jgi:hypothetical protein
MKYKEVLCRYGYRQRGDLVIVAWFKRGEGSIIQSQHERGVRFDKVSHGGSN